MDELDVCMRCGFCRASCPIFEETLAESGTARGKIAIIQAIEQGTIEPSEGAAKKIFECTLCGRCGYDCPAGVDTIKLFINARKKLLINAQSGRKQAVFNIIERPNALSFFGKVARILPDRVIVTPKENVNTPHKLMNKPRMKVAFFGGCLINNIMPDIEEAVIDVLAQNNIETIVLQATCCGAPLYFSGAIERAQVLASENLSMIELADVDAVVTACPTCKMGLIRYPEILDDGKSARAQALADKTYEICEFLIKFGYDENFRVLDKHITYHESCHMKYGLGLSETARTLIGSVPGVELLEMYDPQACCGFGGLFSIDNPKLSGQMLKKKINDIKKTDAYEVITPCPGCLLSIRRGLKKEGLNMKVRHPINLLSEAYRKSGSR